MDQNDFCIDFTKFIEDTAIDEDTARDLYKIFAEELLEQRDCFVDAFQNRDYLKMGKIIHNIKGISGSYMAFPLNIIAKNIDILIKNELYQDLYTECEDFERIVGKTIETIEAF